MTDKHGFCLNLCFLIKVMNNHEPQIMKTKKKIIASRFYWFKKLINFCEI